MVADKKELHLDVYTDGSFHSEYKVYSGGLVILMSGLDNPLEYKVCGNDPKYTPLANIAGEVLAAMQALQIADKAGATSITIYHDYAGIHNWTKEPGEEDYWLAKRMLSKQYVAYVWHLRTDKALKINFKHTPGHSGIEYNELADKLAKAAIREYILSN